MLTSDVQFKAVVKKKEEQQTFPVDIEVNMITEIGSGFGEAGGTHSITYSQSESNRRLARYARVPRNARESRYPEK